MKVVAWYSEHKREVVLAQAIVDGCAAHGVRAKMRVKGRDDWNEDCDLACMVGVKNLELFRAYRKRGINVAYFDKGYVRRLHRTENGGEEWMEYWRVAVNAHQPVSYVEMAKCESSRAKDEGLRLLPWRVSGEAILVDGSSAKHYAFHDLGDPTAVARETIDGLRKLSDRPIIYRPKPSWRGAVPIDGTEYSTGKDFRPAFARAHVLVTYGSNLCFDAVLAGVPCIVLGEGIARPISSTSIEDAERPRLASDDVRKQWLANVAWCQFSKYEIATGVAWPVIKDMIVCATAS